MKDRPALNLFYWPKSRMFQPVNKIAPEHIVFSSKHIAVPVAAQSCMKTRENKEM
jgi:hypothetical protein